MLTVSGGWSPTDRASEARLALCAGAGVQGSIQAAGGGGKRFVRFGSAKFAAEVLPDDLRQALLQQVGHCQANRSESSESTSSLLRC